MKITSVSLGNAAEYVRYCKRHGAEHDESFLPGDAFAPTDEYPAYVSGVISGVTSGFLGFVALGFRGHL